MMLYERVWISLEACDRLGILSTGKAMNPSKNDFLAKDEDDEGDTYYQTCTSIGHRVYKSSLDPFVYIITVVDLSCFCIS